MMSNVLGEVILNEVSWAREWIEGKYPGARLVNEELDVDRTPSGLQLTVRFECYTNKEADGITWTLPLEDILQEVFARAYIDARYPD